MINARMHAAILTVVVVVAVAYGQYQPTWPSLDARPLPAWYDESKIGIFIHFGVFSVPAYGSEWFWWYWQGSHSKQYVDFMNKTYPPGFSYADFAPSLTMELWDPNQWADLFAKAGAKYVVLTSKHHEGWCNWKTNVSWNWNTFDNGPHRDVVGELTTAVRKQGLVMGLYHSLFEWFNPLYLQDKANKFSTTRFVDEKTMPELYEIVNAYQPEIIWSDGDWEANDSYWKSKEFLAWLYNDSPVKDTVAVNDRWGIGDSCKHGGYLTCADRYSPGHLQPRKWENALTLDKGSWGFNRLSTAANYLSMSELLTQLASTIACGGNVLINIGPNHDGTIATIMQERLLSLGDWLTVNGEAIYSSHPWREQNETSAGPWYTSQPSKGAVYAIALSWPAGNTLTLNIPVTTSSTAVSMLGYSTPLSWSALPGKGLTIHVDITPDKVPCKDAWVFKLTNVQ